MTDLAIALPATIDDAELKFGLDIYSTMMHDSAVQGIVNATVSLVVQAKPVILPSHAVNEWEEFTPDQIDDAKTAQAVADFCNASVERIGISGVSMTGLIRESVEQAIVYGFSTSETVYEYIESGPYAGYLMHKSIRTKPRDNIVHIVDQQNILLGVQGVIPGQNWVVLRSMYYDKKVVESIPGFVPASKLFLFSFWPKYSHPLGRSLLRGAYNDFLARKIGREEELKAIVVHGSGIFTAEADKSVPRNQEEINQINELLSQMKSCGYGTLTPGWQLKRHDPPASEPFGNFDQRRRTNMAESVVGAARGLIESKNGSKADAAVAQDTMSVIAEVIAESWGEQFRSQVLYYLVYFNFGADIAAKYTPKVVLNTPTYKDVPAIATALAQLYQSGAATDAMMPEMFGKWLNVTYRVGGNSKVDSENEQAAESAQRPTAPKNDSGPPTTTPTR